MKTRHMCGVCHAGATDVGDRERQKTCPGAGCKATVSGDSRGRSRPGQEVSILIPVGLPISKTHLMYS